MRSPFYSTQLYSASIPNGNPNEWKTTGNIVKKIYWIEAENETNACLENIYALSWHETMIKRRVKFVVNEQRSRRKRIGMLQATCDASQATRHIKRTSDLFCIQRSTGGSVPHWLYNSRLNTIQSTANVQIVLYLLHFNDNWPFQFQNVFFCVAPHSKLIEYLFVIPVIDYLLYDDLNIFYFPS